MRVLALAAVVAIVACSKPAPAPQTVASAEPAPEASPEELHIVTRASGSQYPTIVQQVSTPHGPRTVYELRALSYEADGEGKDSSAVFEQPHVTFHDKDGGTLIADAPKATVTGRDKSVVMMGGVRARSQDGATLACDRLRYDGHTERLHGEGHVLLTSATGVSFPGDIFDGDVRLNDVRVRSHR